MSPPSLGELSRPSPSMVASAGVRVVRVVRVVGGVRVVRGGTGVRVVRVLSRGTMLRSAPPSCSR